MTENVQDAHAQQPLRGVVLCSTSLNQDVRTRIGDVAMQMGAVHKLDLTSDVTHLLVGQVDTPKYRHVAKERSDIYVLHPAWIDALRKAWIDGDDIDVAAFTHQYRLPTFFGLHICVTGFDDLRQRLDMQETVNTNGATYHGDLTKVVTHLVAAKPRGAKYDRARTWGMRIVSLQWYHDCLARGMVLEESKYDPLLSAEDQGRGTFHRDYKRRPSPGKRLREPEGDGAASDNPGKRKMRRTASTRLSSHSQNMWADLSTVEQQDDSGLDDQWAETSETMRAEGVDDTSLATLPADVSVSDRRSEQMRRSASARPFEEEEQALFSGWTCLAIGHEAKNDVQIRKILAQNGATIAHSPGDLHAAAEDRDSRHALIVPRTWMKDVTPSLPHVPAGTVVVTEWWLERCLIQKTLLDPDEDVLSRPFLHLSKNLFSGSNMVTSGLGFDIMQISRLVKLAGGTYQEQLERTTTVFVQNPEKVDGSTKLLYAMDRSIPIVTPEWLHKTVSSGALQPYADFALPTSLLLRLDDLRESKRQAQRSGSAGGADDAGATSKRKDSPPAHRLSSIRKRGATGSLPLARSAPASVGRPSMLRKAIATSTVDTEPLSTEDSLVPSADEFDGTADECVPAQTASLPLRELPSEVNSPHKRSQETLSTTALSSMRPSAGGPFQEDSSSETEAGGSKENEERPHTTREAPRNKEIDLSVLQEVIQRSRQVHINNASLKPAKPGKRRIGRVQSGTSTASFTRPTNLEVGDSIDSVTPLMLDGSLATKDEPPMPSQQLLYDAPGAEEHRQLMSKRMGTNFADEGGTRVESIGVVRDANISGKAGVGERVRGRHRDAAKLR